MNILAIVSHPDDAVLCCGGTLAKHADQGDDVTVAYLSRGEWGGDRSERELARIRESEATRGAETIGASTLFLDQRDGRISYSLDLRFDIVEVIREECPDLVITWSRSDPHPDHRITSELVRDACQQVHLPAIETDASTCDRPKLYTIGSSPMAFSPDLFVDISEYVQLKEEAIREHESQLKWLEGDPLEWTRRHNALYAEQSDADYAEGFGYVSPHVVNELLE